MSTTEMTTCQAVAGGCHVHTGRTGPRPSPLYFTQVLPALVRVISSPSSQPPMMVEGSLDLLRTLANRKRRRRGPGSEGDQQLQAQLEAEQAAEMAVARKVREPDIQPSTSLTMCPQLPWPDCAPFCNLCASVWRHHHHRCTRTWRSPFCHSYTAVTTQVSSAVHSSCCASW
jgi:hypothetical protein